MKDRLPNSEQFERLIQAILAKPSGETYSLDDFMAALKTDIDAAKAIAPVGTEITVSGVTQEISTSQGNVNGASSAGVTGVSVNAATYSKKTGGQTGTNSFYYDGSSWRLGSQTGQWVNLPDYGITVQGTPVSGDYITVTVPTSSIVLRVAAYDRYEPANPNVKHTVALECKDLVKDGQQLNYPNNLFMAVSKKAMPSGKYKFTAFKAYQAIAAGTAADVTDGVYVFTTTKETPVGGGLYCDSIGTYNPGADTIANGSVKIVGADHVVANALETCQIHRYSSSTDADAIDLGTYTGISTKVSEVPFASRENEYGSMMVISDGYTFGDYATSTTRQWLNADKSGGGWFDPTISSYLCKPDSNWTDQRAGFVYCLPPELRKYLCKVKVKTSLDTGMALRMQSLSLSKPVEWGGGCNATVEKFGDTHYYAVTEDAVFLPSFGEMGSDFADYYDPANSPLPIYEGAQNADRVKEFDGNPTRYWLRGQLCDTGYNGDYYGQASNGTAINADGSRSYLWNATDFMGVAPIIVLG